MNDMSMGAGFSDDALLGELGRRLARERLQRDLTQAALAEEAGLSLSTVRRLEGGQGCNLSALLRVLRVLGLLANLEALVPAQPPSPLQALEHDGAQRRRASPRRDDDPPPGEPAPWTWGDDR